MTRVQYRFVDPLVAETLEAAGWSASRLVDVAPWSRWYRSEGYAHNDAVLDLLESLGGLSFDAADNPEARFGKGHISFDPIVAAEGETERIRERALQLGEAVWPIGEWDLYVLLLSASGKVYAEAPSFGVLLVGADLSAALTTLITRTGELRQVAD